MLYGTNAARTIEASDGGDRDYDPRPVRGLADLGANSPLRRPGIITVSGGGGYAPQGAGGGGAPTGTEYNVAGSRIRSGYAPGNGGTPVPGIGPADRNTSAPIFNKAAQASAKARYNFQKSGRGGKESPMSPSWSGLSGVDLGLGGLDSWLSDRFKHAERLITPSVALKNNATRVYRVTAATAVGAASGFIVGGPAGAIAGGAYGLGKGIYGTQVGNPVGRMLYQTAGPALILGTAAGAATGQGLFATKAATATVVAPGASPLSLGVSAPAFGSAGYAPAGYAAPSAFGGSGTALAPSLAPAAISAPGSASLMAASATQTAAPVATGFGTAGYAPAGYATPSSILATTPAGAPAASAAPGFFAKTGSSLLTGTGTVLKTVAISVGAQAIMAGLAKPQPGQPGYDNSAATPYGYGETAASGPMPIFIPNAGGSAGSAADEPSVIMAGMSPLIGLALAGVGLALLMGKTKIRRSK